VSMSDSAIDHTVSPRYLQLTARFTDKDPYL